MKKKLLSSMILGLCLAVSSAIPALADSRKVVTLGNDLSPEQKDMMMRYFGVGYDNVDLLYITNTDEREHLGSYVPLEQIGNYTYSCALVSPTSSGGIQVKTANLEWVTCNMIASTLSTSGVTNCQVVAASPFKVSGTGALTGVIMAYEEASRVVLEPQKVELANQELVTTGNLANQVGQSKATAVINETKLEVIENNITNIDEINTIVENVSNEYNIVIDEEQSAEIAELMQKIAEQEYDITQLKATLDRVQANVIGDAGASEEEVKAAEEKAEASEQAAMEAAKQEAQEMQTEVVDEDGVIITDDAEEIYVEESEETESILDFTDPSVFEEAGEVVEEVDTTQSVQEQSEQQETEVPTETETPVETELVEEVWTEEDLTEEDKKIYDKIKEELKQFFAGTELLFEDGSVVYLTEDATKEIPSVLEEYLLRLMIEGEEVIAAEEEIDAELPVDIVKETAEKAPDKHYENPQLVQIDKFVRRMVFKDSECILAESQLEEKDEQLLYHKLMEILEKAYQKEEILETEQFDAEVLETEVSETEMFETELLEFGETEPVSE